MNILEVYLTEHKDHFPVSIIVALLDWTTLWLPNEDSERTVIGSYPPDKRKD